MTWQPERPAFGAYEHAMPYVPRGTKNYTRTRSYILQYMLRWLRMSLFFRGWQSGYNIDTYMALLFQGRCAPVSATFDTTAVPTCPNILPCDRTTAAAHTIRPAVVIPDTVGQTDAT